MVRCLGMRRSFLVGGRGEGRELGSVGGGTVLGVGLEGGRRDGKREERTET